jgi:uncharacterized membrane protein YkvA (DUF1232 family)
VALALVIPCLASPADLIPDFIPVLGLFDDALLVAAILGHLARKAGPEVIAELWPGSEYGWKVVVAFAKEAG